MNILYYNKTTFKEPTYQANEDFRNKLIIYGR